MSWWDDGDDVLGDRPADKLKAAWRTVLARRAERDEGPPTTDVALASFAAALRAAGLDPPFTRLVLWRGRERLRDFDGSGADPELERAFAAAFTPIAADYQRQVERGPRPSELIKTLDFILTPEPANYLADAAPDDWETLRLRAG
jgi:hypothetical protein